MYTIKMQRNKNQDHQNQIFFQVPKFLFNEEFKSLSSTSKILYAMLKERHELSLKNNWINNSGEVYHIMTQENMAKELGVSLRTVTRAVKLLTENRLIEVVSIGLNMPNEIYLNLMESSEYPQPQLSNQKDRKRYKRADINNHVFFQIPKFLFEEPFINLNNDARLLYGILKDRNEISIANNYFNENGEIFFTYSREEMSAMLNLSRPTIIKTIDILKTFNLLEEERLGLSKKNRIFLNQINSNSYNRPITPLDKSIESINFNKNLIKNIDKSHLTLTNYRSKDMACPEVKIWRVQKQRYGVSRSKDMACPEVKIWRTSNNELSNNELSNINTKSVVQEESSKELPYSEIISYLNKKADKDNNSEVVSKENKKMIKDLFDAGYSLEDFYNVIDSKVFEWKNSQKMNNYLRPCTLFKNNFEKYLRESMTVQTKNRITVLQPIYSEEEPVDETVRLKLLKKANELLKRN